MDRQSPVKTTKSGSAAPGNETIVFLIFVFAGFVLFLFRGVLPELKLFVERVSITFVAVVIEALGFVLIGSLIGGIIEEFLPTELIGRINKKMPRAIVFVTAASGIIFPICECAIVPVTRRLIKKGIPLHAAVAFLLAVPIVNPVVWVTTFIAFGNDITTSFIRFGSGYVIAVVVGFIFHRFYPDPGKAVRLGKVNADGGDCHGCTAVDHSGHEHHHNLEGGRLSDKVRRVLGHSKNDFFDVVKYLILGAFIAACLRTLIGNSGMEGLSSSVLSVPSAMGTAFILNLCSEADAFIGASFRGMLPLASIMGFLILGPMLDIKLLSAYKLLFTRGAIIKLALLIVGAVGVWCLAMFFITGGSGV
jgi:hypothetical protein